MNSESHTSKLVPTHIVDCWNEQRNELELLQSMYSANELEIGHSAVDSSPSSSNENPEIRLKLKNDDVDLRRDVELTVQFPSGYPLLEAPSVLVRVSSWTNAQSSLLNEALRSFVLSRSPGAPLVMEMVAWLNDNIANFAQPESPPASAGAAADSDRRLTRYWIYSHHIYSKVKRKDMLSLAADLKLTGFQLPGKPGVVCVEGNDADCRQFWDTIRRWTWKKILIKHKEEEEGEARFKDFQELRFQPITGGDHHMDMSAFRRFLDDVHCQNAFKILFGLEGK